MIPRRLYLKNFMSYKEPREIVFRDAQLWALCGDNGSGKSTVFDAITYALFDEHRLGKQHADRLIHKGEDQLYIEFDFAIDKDEYRIKRSHHRKGIATRQVIHLEGPNVPEPGRNGPQAIRETDGDDGFKRWIERMIGLNYSAFTSSALLLQGKSDALLKAKPADRHAMLTQIIDLDPYIRLYSRASERYKESESRKKDVEGKLRTLAVVDELRITDLLRAIESELLEKKKHYDLHLLLTRLKVESEQWWSLCDERQEYQEKLQHLQALVEQEKLLTQQSARYHELSGVLPPLRVILQQQERCRAAQQILVALTAQQEESTQKKQNAEVELRRIQQELIQARSRQRGLVQQQLDNVNRRMKLTPQISDIDTLLKKRQDCIQLDECIASYSTDIDMQLADAQQTLLQMQAIRHILTPLNQFYTARNIWQQHELDLRQVTERISSLSQQIKENEQHEREREATFKDWQQKESAARASVAHGRALLQDPQQRLDNLKEVDGTAQCRYCGHTLTPEHLQAERERLMAQIKCLADELSQYQLTYEYSSKEREHAEEVLKEARKTRDLLLLEHSTAQQEQAALTATRQGQETVAREALSYLNPDYVRKITFSDPITTDISSIFVQSSYPTEQDIQSLRDQLTQEQSVQKTIADLQNVIGQRNRLRDRRADIEEEVRALEERYPPELIQHLLAEHEQIATLLENLQHLLQEVDDLLKSQETDEKAQQDIYQSLARQEQKLSDQIASERNRIDSAQYILEARLQELSAEWQVQVQSTVITAENLATWEGEKEQLVQAEQQLQQLNEERGRKQFYEQNVQRLDKKLVAIPLEAQRPIIEIQNDIEQAMKLLNEAEQRIVVLRDEHAKLEQLKLRRTELEKDLKEHARKSYLYKSLYTLLGPNSLQRYLLQRAEQAIVAYANETLDKISGGTLRLELVKYIAKGTRALDLVAYNYAVNQTQPLEVELLSGSQQFRVAVSLALGIGKYAGGESRRVETVIIDEGFGSLDTSGRQDMIHVLQALKNELACIIVVSHQDEFFDEFENKYRMALINGCTQVSIV